MAASFDLFLIRKLATAHATVLRRPAYLGQAPTFTQTEASTFLFPSAGYGATRRLHRDRTLNHSQALPPREAHAKRWSHSLC